MSSVENEGYWLDWFDPKDTHKFVSDAPCGSAIKDIFTPSTFDLEAKPCQGVYLLSDFYVGQSRNIQQRLNMHAYDERRGEKTSGPLGIKAYFDKYGRVKIPVSWLSYDVSDEEFFIKFLFEKGFPLVNHNLLRAGTTLMFAS